MRKYTESFPTVYAQILSGRPLLHTAVAWGTSNLEIPRFPPGPVLPVGSVHNGEWTRRQVQSVVVVLDGRVR